MSPAQIMERYRHVRIYSPSRLAGMGFLLEYARRDPAVWSSPRIVKFP